MVQDVVGFDILLKCVFISANVYLLLAPFQILIVLFNLNLAMC